uniref:Uncharacterized protein n=1 Tax=Salix viminalis TaxID=40686 RepID=A0A6N2KX87_SALVM
MAINYRQFCSQMDQLRKFLSSQGKYCSRKQTFTTDTSSLKKRYLSFEQEVMERQEPSNRT